MESVPKAKELMKEFDKAVDVRRDDEAYVIVRRALAAQKEGCSNHRCGYVAEILSQMGGALHSTGRYEEALTLLAEAEEIAKEVEAGGCYEMRGVRLGVVIRRAHAIGSTQLQPQEFISAAREAVAYAVRAFGEGSAEHGEALVVLSSAMIHTARDPARALKVADKALAMLERTNRLNNAAAMRKAMQLRMLCLKWLGRTEEADAARTMSSLASGSGSDHTTAVLLKVQSLVAEGKHAEARDVLSPELERARAQLGDRNLVVTGLASFLITVCHDCDQWEQAVEHGRLVFHKPTTASSVFFQQAFGKFLAALLKLGREDEAHALVKAAPRWAELGHPVPPRVLALASMERPATDLYFALRAEMAYPAEVRDAVDRAEEMFVAEQSEAATEVLTGAVEAAKTVGAPARVVGQLLMRRAVLRTRLLDFQSAIADADEAEVLAPGSGAFVVAESARALALRGRGSFKEAAIAKKELGNRVYRFRPWEPESALAYFDMAVKFDPELASAHFNRGVMLARIPARSGEARAAFERALELAEAQGDAALAAKARKKLGL